MTRPRSLLIDDQVEGTYHCVSRCVRRAFLHGEDPLTGKNYDYRKGWIHDRLVFLAKVFLIDVGGYAVMDNHFHVILRNRPDLASAASSREVARRWLRLYPRRRDEDGVPLEPSAEEIEGLVADEFRINLLRRRLSSISWFMKCLKEYISRKANADDGCGGRFWESRFKSTVLLDDAAVLTCLVYVDLNPIRAGVAETPETSVFTSAEERIRGFRARQAATKLDRGGSPGQDVRSDAGRDCDRWLCPLQTVGTRRGLLSIDLPSYLEILDWTGRRVVAGKLGVIPDHLPPILLRLSINPNRWLESARCFGSLFSVAAGTERHMKEAAIRLSQKWVCGVQAGKALFLD